MERIGLYKQLTPFTNQNAGTAEWCTAEKDGVKYFVKKFQSPVYPSKDLGLPEKKYQSRVVRFHAAEEARKTMYRALRENDTSGTLVVPVEVINYQYHICTIAEYISCNVSSNEIHQLSEWQRLVLMRTLTLALINVHRAGVVHSDMKPDNVLIYQNPDNGSCALKLIDFDGSFMSSNPPEDVTGDPAFFAPEAYAMSTMPGIQLNERIDIFALGIIFHFFWTGKLPEKSADQTIGQCILNGIPVKLDPAIPSELRAIIEKALVGNPDKRITGEAIYNELGKMLPSYPVKIINLQTGKKAAVPPAAKKRSGGSETEKKKSVSIPVLHCDKEGHTLRGYSIEIDYGKNGSACAESIPGYHIISSRERIVVSVDEIGRPSETPIRFTYDKDKKTASRKKSIFAILLVLGLVYCVVMYALAHNSVVSGNYEEAKRYMDFFPFYKDFFPDEWLYTDEQVQLIENKRYEQRLLEQYNQAVSQYRNKEYRAAYSLFVSIDDSYQLTELYKDFCLAHTNRPQDYFPVIYENISFEDAKDLLVYNTKMFCKYMLGSWTAESSANDTRTVTMRDNGGDSFTANNLPEIGEGYTFSVSDGSFIVTNKDENTSFELFTIRIINRNSFEMYSLQTYKTYRYTKN